MKRKIITLCGSSRFVDVMAVCSWLIERDEQAIALTLHLLPVWYAGDLPDDHLAEHFLKKVDSPTRYLSSIVGTTSAIRLGMKSCMQKCTASRCVGTRTIRSAPRVRSASPPFSHGSPAHSTWTTTTSLAEINAQTTCNAPFNCYHLMTDLSCA